jgi:serine transporter
LSWVLALFGTAVGAGILFLPIQAGEGGFWSLGLVILLIYPTIVVGHRLYALIPGRSPEPAEFSAAVAQWLPARLAAMLHWLMILWLLVVLIAYGTSLINDLVYALQEHGILQHAGPHRPWLGLGILGGLILALRLGRPVLVRLLGGLSLMLIGLLCLVSLALIPHWSMDAAASALAAPDPASLLRQFLLLFPLLTFSFIFFPALSKLVLEIRSRLADSRAGRERIEAIIRATTLVQMGLVLSFVVSFMLAIPKGDFADAARENISALAMLGELYPNSWLGDLGPAISALSLTTSFIGIFIGYRESVLSLLPQARIRAWHDNLIYGATLLLVWGFAAANVPVMEILGDLASPLAALFLFLTPAWVVLRGRGFEGEQGIAPWFSFAAGVLVVLSYFVGTALG